MTSIYSEVTAAKNSLDEDPALATNYLCSFLPKGVYEFEVVNVELKHLQSTPFTPYFIINLQVASGDYQGYVGADIIGASDEHMSNAVSKIESILMLAGESVASSHSTLDDYAKEVSYALEGIVFRAACQQSDRGKALKVSYFSAVDWTTDLTHQQSDDDQASKASGLSTIDDLPIDLS